MAQVGIEPIDTSSPGLNPRMPRMTDPGTSTPPSRVSSRGNQFEPESPSTPNGASMASNILNLLSRKTVTTTPSKSSGLASIEFANTAPVTDLPGVAEVSIAGRYGRFKISERAHHGGEPFVDTPNSSINEVRLPDKYELGNRRLVNIFLNHPVTELIMVSERSEPDEDENTRDESREMGAGIIATSTTKLTLFHTILLTRSFCPCFI